jgi:magnesium-transporting ATPase (P-type)
VVTGAQLERLDSSDIQHLLHSTCVFARVAPHQKLLLVEAAQTAGHFVAVTGDGVNDATALRAANIGVAMGKSGTDVAREAADLVISDDNFATLVAGVEEGRIAYDNVRKVIYLLVSTGAAEIVLVGLAVVTGLPLPLLPVQLLWLNLVTNGIQHIGLAFEPGTAKVLQRPPRSPREPIFNALMVQRTLLAAAVMGGVGFSLFSYLLAQPEGNLTMARSALLLLMVLFENVHVGNCRCESTSALRLSPLRNPILVVGTLAAFTIHAVVMHRPVGQGLLSIRPVPLETWGLVIPLSLTVLVAIEVDKRIRSLGRRR